MRYTEQQLVAGIEALIQVIENQCGLGVIEQTCKDHPCVDEIQQHGALGPTGRGLGQYGGHAP